MSPALKWQGENLVHCPTLKKKQQDLCFSTDRPSPFMHIHNMHMRIHAHAQKKFYLFWRKATNEKVCVHDPMHCAKRGRKIFCLFLARSAEGKKIVCTRNATFLKNGGKNYVPSLKNREKIMSPNFGHNFSPSIFSRTYFFPPR